MTPLVWNVLLAVVWAAATGSVSLGNLTLGFALGYMILAFTADATRSRRYVRRVARSGWLLVFFLRALVAANLRVAYDVVTPRHRMSPALVAVPLDARSDLELLVLTNMIALTPGAMSVDVSPDRQVLYVHGMYVDDVEVFRRTVKETFEASVLTVTR